MRYVEMHGQCYLCETARSPSQVPQLRETARSPCQVPRQLIPCDMSRCMANVTFVRQLGALFFKFTSISLHEMSSHVMVWWDSGRVHHRRDPRGALRWQEGPERGSSVVRGGPERGSLVWQGGPERGSSVVKGDPLGAPLWQGGPERGSSVAGGPERGSQHIWHHTSSIQDIFKTWHHARYLVLWTCHQGRPSPSSWLHSLLNVF